MLFDFFHCNGIQAESNIKETVNSLRISVSSNQSMRTFITKLFDELKTISDRDSFELFFDICGNHVSISDTSKTNYDLLISHIDDNDESDPFDIELNISKKCQNSTLSVYFIEALTTYLAEEKISNVLSTISSHFDGKLLFEVFSTINCFYSSGIIFFQSGFPPREYNFTQEKKRDSQIEMFKENGSISDLNLKLLPCDFYLAVESEDENINKLFSKVTGVLSLIFISSSSKFKVDGKLAYKINGYKTVFCDGVEQEELEKSSQLLHKIYAWAYEGGNNVDKLGLVRNVLSIHLDGKGLVQFDHDAWEAIKSNYQVYLKENIQSYLEVKNKIGEFIIDATSKTYSMADELLESLKNNVLVILTFLLTVVIVNGLKANGYTTVFSNSYFAIVIILSIMSGFWLLMIRTETLKRFNHASATIREILKLNYEKIIMESEISEIVDPVITKNKRYLEKQIKRYTVWWVILLTVFVLSFGIANRILARSQITLSKTEKVTEISKENPVKNKLNKSIQPTARTTAN